MSDNNTPHPRHQSCSNVASAPTHTNLTSTISMAIDTEFDVNGTLTVWMLQCRAPISLKC